ncbi:MAG: acyl-CoA desaturase [Candidatus Binataceae bacterium]
MSTALLDGELGRPEASPPTHSLWPTGIEGLMVLAWLLLIHLTSAMGLIMYPLPGWRLLFVFVVLAFVGGVGTTVCYHRALAHRSVRLHPAVQSILIFFAMLNGAAPPGSWVPTHRLHHATADTPDDPSSPVWRGLWWAHVAWHWRPDNPVRAKYATDLKRDSLGIWSRLLVPMFFLAYFGGAAWGPAAFFWLGSIRLVFAFHATSFVNSVCHTEPGVAPGEDSSRNVSWVALMQFFLGENWHRNHHRSPSSARLGWNWRQPDLGYLLIVALEKLGLATDVRRPSRTVDQMCSRTA